MASSIQPAGDESAVWTRSKVIDVIMEVKVYWNRRNRPRRRGKP